MSQTLSDVVPSLVDQPIITTAQDNLDAKVAQFTAAQASATAAEQAYVAAQATLADAVQGKGSVSPLDAANQVEDTDRAQRVANMVQQAAAKAADDAREALRVAVGKAWRPVYLAGARQRVAAAHAADAARLALVAAENAHVEATRILDAATNNGTIGVQAATEGSRRQMTTEQEEIEMWISNGFDPVAGTYPRQWN